MVDPTHPRISIVRQCRLVSIARSSFYYAGTGESPLTLRLMRLIDEQFLETPFYGSRQMTRWLRRQGDMVSRKRVRRLMRLLGVHALYQRPRMSQPHPAHRIYPSLPLLLPGESRRRDSRMIAALYVESRGVYAGLPDVDLWDRDRDARTYAGPWPVVAHPPGARWGRSWGGHPTQQPRLVLGDDEGCFAAALDAMRRHGGVLEPPEASPAWTGLRTPHATESRRVVVTAWQGEWTCCVEKDTTGTAPARPQGGTQWAARCLAPAGEERSGQ